MVAIFTGTYCRTPSVRSGAPATHAPCWMLQLGEDRHGGLRRCRKALAHRLRAGGRRPWRGWEQWEVAIGDEEGGREGSETGGLRWGSASKIPVWDGRHGGRLGRGGRRRAGWEVVLAGVGGGARGSGVRSHPQPGCPKLHHDTCCYRTESRCDKD